MAGVAAEVATHGTLRMLDGMPGAVAGHAAMASSYFDRLKAKEGHGGNMGAHRYSLCLQRVCDEAGL
eukprot:SAG11_NODE_14017_length_628_cov_1.739130_1_plen_66_part_10